MSDEALTRTTQALLDLAAAIDNGDPDRRHDALTRFEDNVLYVADAGQRTRLQELRTELEAAAAEAAFATFGLRIAEAFGDLPDAFGVGEAMANEGRDSLFFPAAAAHLGRIAAMIKQLKKAADTVSNNIGAMATDITEHDVDGLIDKAREIQTVVDELVGSMEGVRGNLPS